MFFKKLEHVNCCFLCFLNNVQMALGFLAFLLKYFAVFTSRRFVSLVRRPPLNEYFSLIPQKKIPFCFSWFFAITNTVESIDAITVCAKR